MIRKLHINESANYSDGVVNCTVSHLFEYDDEVFRDLIDWCNDYLSGNDLDAYVQTTRTYNNELSVFYDIEDLDTTTHEEVEDVINQAVEDFFDNEINENCLTESSDWRTNPNRLNDVEDVFVNDIFVDKRGNKVKVLKVNKDDFTIKNINTGVVSRIRKDYLINRFELTDDFAECFPCKTSYVNEKISDQDYSQSKKGVAYKVFRIKDGKLYPPMVANPGGQDTPLGVWLDAEEGEFAGLSKTGRKQVKSTGSGNLAYRPGWHLGDVPRAKQFDRSFSWTFVDVDEDTPVEKTVSSYNTFVNSCAKASNIGKVYYIKELDSYVQVVNNNAPYFPYDFLWAECEYIMDINYQGEADEQGYMRTKPDGTTYRSDKYQHSLAGLPKLPERGYYKYRTNPNPDTVPWVITGAIKVTKLLDDYDVKQILGGNAPERQGGDKTLSELGLKQIN